MLDKKLCKSWCSVASGQVSPRQLASHGVMLVLLSQLHSKDQAAGRQPGAGIGFGASRWFSENVPQASPGEQDPGALKHKAIATLPLVPTKSKNKTDPRTRMHYTKTHSKSLMIDSGQRQESATRGNEWSRRLSSTTLVSNCYQRLLSATRVNNIKRREKT